MGKRCSYSLRSIQYNRQKDTGSTCSHCPRNRIREATDVAFRPGRVWQMLATPEAGNPVNWVTFRRLNAGRNLLELELKSKSCDQLKRGMTIVFVTQQSPFSCLGFLLSFFFPSSFFPSSSSSSVVSSSIALTVTRGRCYVRYSFH